MRFPALVFFFALIGFRYKMLIRSGYLNKIYGVAAVSLIAKEAGAEVIGLTCLKIILDHKVKVASSVVVISKLVHLGVEDITIGIIAAIG